MGCAGRVRWVRRVRSARKCFRCVFFFQAEDGIRDLTVTGVQTCALPIYFGQILIRKRGEGFVLCHRDDESKEDLETFGRSEDAIGIARYDEAGNYRPLKT